MSQRGFYTCAIERGVNIYVCQRERGFNTHSQCRIERFMHICVIEGGGSMHIQRQSGGGLIHMCVIERGFNTSCCICAYV